MQKACSANTIVCTGRKANPHVKPVREITFYLKNKVPQSNFFLHILYKPCKAHERFFNFLNKKKEERFKKKKK